MLTPSTVSMISNDNRCFVSGWTGHFCCHCPNVQCYSCNESSHFAQDCPNKIPPSGTPSHQDRSCSRPQYTHTQREQITIQPLWTQTWEIFQPITIMLPFPPQQEQQQSQKAHKALPIQQPQWMTPPFKLIDTPNTTHTKTHATGIVTPHPTLTTSPTNITHTTIS